MSFTSLNTGIVIDNQSTYNHAFVMDNLSVSAMPEPEGFVLMLAGLGVTGLAMRRRSTQRG